MNFFWSAHGIFFDAEASALVLFCQALTQRDRDSRSRMEKKSCRHLASRNNAPVVFARELGGARGKTSRTRSAMGW